MFLVFEKVLPERSVRFWCRCCVQMEEGDCSVFWSMRKGTWLEGSSMTCGEVSLLISFCVHEFTHSDITMELHVGSGVVVTWNKFCTEIFKHLSRMVVDAL